MNKIDRIENEENKSSNEANESNFDNQSYKESLDKIREEENEQKKLII